MQHRRVNVLLAVPFFLNDLVHNPAVEDIVEIELIEIPEAIVALVISLLDHEHHLIGVVEHL